MSEITPYTPPAEATYLDPTGGRLVAWAEAASAANQLAKALSQTAFVPKEMTNVGNATAAILMGDELGMSPIASLRSIYVVHGTPALYARSMVALALAHGHEIWTEETSDAKVVVCGRRRGSENVERAEWTIARAQKAGYTGNKKYASNPQEMLYAKAAAEVARKIAADTLAGIPYSVEDLELGDEPTVTVTRETARRKVQRAQPTEAEPEVAPDPEPEAEAAEAADDTPPELDPITDAQLKALHAAFNGVGIEDRDARLEYASKIIGREVESSKALTKAEASTLLDTLST